MSSFGSDKIQALLKADSTLLSLLDSFTVGSTAYPAIFHALIAPDNFTGVKYITYYRTTPVDATLAYTDTVYTINCRANTFSDAEGIQSQVNSILNRKNTLSGKGILLCSVLRIIPPSDETDDYNAPVEVRLKLV